LNRGRCVLAPLVTVVALGCGRPVSQAECHTLLERYVELLVQSDRPDVKAGELLRMKQEARKKATGDPAFSTCQKDVSRRAFDCAMRAPNADQLEQCLL
jgi:hypothetical protein